MHLKSLPGKVTQLRRARLGLWRAFLVGWLRRKESAVVPCVVPGSNRLLWVPLKDFYESYWFFCQAKQGCQEMDFFLSQLGNDEVFYDVGSFRGAYSAFAALQVSKRVCVHAFEPLITNVKSIRRVIDLNQFSNVTINPVAVGDSSSIMGGVNEQEGMLRSGDPQASSNCAVVRAILIDDYAKTNLPPTVMKIDVDGFEVSVLRGGRRTLEKHHPRLWLEVHPGFLQQQDRSADEVLTFLREVGYSISFFGDYRTGNPEISYHLWCCD